MTAEPIDPAALLAEALLRIRQADEADEARRRHVLDSTDPYANSAIIEDMNERHAHLVETAHVLTRIAGEVRRAAQAELTTFPLATLEQTTPGEEPAGQYDRPEPTVYLPRPVNGVRFEAVIGGGPHEINMGLVAGREWLYMQGRGFVDITDADQFAVTAEEVPSYRFRGRVVSMTPDHMLGITDGGASVALPMADVRHFPDDQR